MELSLFLAKVIATVYLSVGVGALFNKDYYKKLDAILNNIGVMYLSGFVAIILGFIMVELHNVWVSNWTVLVTIVGWAALVKGIFILAFPEFMIKMSKSLFSGGLMNAFPYITLILGLIFGYFGFIA